MPAVPATVPLSDEQNIVTVLQSRTKPRTKSPTAPTPLEEITETLRSLAQPKASGVNNGVPAPPDLAAAIRKLRGGAR